jgi:Zn/Cd-binding protein ZinT
LAYLLVSSRICRRSAKKLIFGASSNQVKLLYGAVEENVGDIQALDFSGEALLPVKHSFMKIFRGASPQLTGKP